MAIINCLLILVLLIYCCFISLLIYGFDKIKPFEINDLQPTTTFSIIVPCKNESKYLPAFLESIATLNYPKKLFEIILIDDFSTDDSAAIFHRWRVQHGLIQTTLLDNLRLSNSPKKDAISRAIPIVNNQWIITTDADCEVPVNWLKTLDNFIQNNDTEMIIGSVSIQKNNTFFNNFQALDLMSLQGTTIGSFGLQEAFMCNGANFAYTKKIFVELKGFQGNTSIASGDDVFLLQKAISKKPNKVHYIKHIDTIIKTQSEPNLKSFFNQRVRWGGKAKYYDSDFSKALAIIVLIANLNFIIGMALVCFSIIDYRLLIVYYAIKFIFDYLLLSKINQLIKHSKFIFPIFSGLFYSLFCSIAGFYAIFGKYSWKGVGYK